MGDKKRKNDPEDAVLPEGKKAKRESKKEKKEKRKAEEVADAVTPAEVPVQNGEAEKKEKKEKKDKKEKKEKKDKEEKKEKKDKKEKKEKKEKKKKQDEASDDQSAETSAAEQPSADAMDVDVTPAAETAQPVTNGADEATNDKKSKKDKKAKKEKKAKAADSEAPEEQTAEDNAQKQKGARFICFVGNLPFSADHESLTNHFAKIQPLSVRVATQRDKPTKCRGFGFVEFDNYDRMKTCLKLYHHSMFDDGKYPPRRINVELTAGGGGNTEARKAKIEAKNKKLYEERQRNAKEQKKEKEKKKHGEETGQGDYAGVHPSRLGRMA
jgi:nucleolar protein 6